MLDVVVWGVDYRILHRTGHFIHFPTDGPRSCGDRRFPGYSPTVPSDGRRPRRARWPVVARSVVIDPVSPIFIVSSTTRTPNHLDACIVCRVSGSSVVSYPFLHLVSTLFFYHLIDTLLGLPLLTPSNWTHISDPPSVSSRRQRQCNRRTPHIPPIPPHNSSHRLLLLAFALSV